MEVARPLASATRRSATRGQLLELDAVDRLDVGLALAVGGDRQGELPGAVPGDRTLLAQHLHEVAEERHALERVANPRRSSTPASYDPPIACPPRRMPSDHPGLAVPQVSGHARSMTTVVVTGAAERAGSAGVPPGRRRSRGGPGARPRPAVPGRGARRRRGPTRRPRDGRPEAVLRGRVRRPAPGIGVRSIDGRPRDRGRRPGHRGPTSARGRGRHRGSVCGHRVVGHGVRGVGQQPGADHRGRADASVPGSHLRGPPGRGGAPGPRVARGAPGRDGLPVAAVPGGGRRRRGLAGPGARSGVDPGCGIR